MYSLLKRSYLLYFLYHQFSHFFHQFLIVEDDKDDEDDNDVEDNKTDLLYDSGNIVFNNPEITQCVWFFPLTFLCNL